MCAIASPGRPEVAIETLECTPWTYALSNRSGVESFGIRRAQACRGSFSSGIKAPHGNSSVLIAPARVVVSVPRSEPQSAIASPFFTSELHRDRGAGKIDDEPIVSVREF